MNTYFRVAMGTARFLWQRAMRQSEVLGVALGCGASFSLYVLAQLWPYFPAFMIGLFVGPLVTALVAQRLVVVLGALTNSFFIVFCWLFPIFLLHASPVQILVGFSRSVSQNWFPYLAALCGVQVISLLANLPILLFRFSRSRFKTLCS